MLHIIGLVIVLYIMYRIIKHQIIKLLDAADIKSKRNKYKQFEDELGGKD